MIVFADLHLRESSEDVCFRVLAEVERMAVLDDKRVICCGDFWHIRYQLNVRLLNRVAEVMRRWAEMDIELDLVPGNHDQVDVAGRNALEVFEGPNCLVWTEPGVEREGGRLGFVPYRKDPQQQIDELVAVAGEVKHGGIIFGHFGIEGAVMNNGRKDVDGLAAEDVISKRFIGAQSLVLGHYHQRQQGNGWEYVGSPYQTSYGEVGNVCGVLHIDGGTLEREWIPLDVGAPTHHILKWDPAKSPEPPQWPPMSLAPNESRRLKEITKVRLDIEASHEMIVSGKFKGVLASAGLADVEIRVIPTKVDREHKFVLRGGESLLEAAGRFAGERMPGGVQAQEQAMSALKRWAK